MNTPLYQGEMPAVSRAPQAQIPTSHPMQATWDANRQRATQNAYALEETMVEYLEDYRSQQLQAEEKQINADLKSELEIALQKANGASGSLFKLDGTPDPAAVKALTSKYQNRVTNWQKGFINLGSRQTAALAQQNFRSAIDQTVRATMIASLKPRAMTAFKANYDLALKQGNREQAIGAANDIYAKGYISEPELMALHMDADERYVDYQLDTISSLNEAVKLRRNLDFMSHCTPHQRQQLNRFIESQLNQAKKGKVVRKPGADPASLNPDDYTRTANIPPSGLTVEYENLWNEYNGDFGSKNPEGQRKAAANLIGFIRKTIDVNDPYNTQYERSVMEQMSAFGVSRDDVKSALNEVRSMISGGMDFQKTIDNIPANALMPMASDTWLYKTYNEMSEQEKYQFYSGSGKDITTLNNEVAANRQRDAYATYLQQNVSKEEADLFLNSGVTPKDYHDARVKAIRDLISQEYSVWLATGRNKHMDDEAKLTHLNRICNSYISSPAAGDSVKQANANRKNMLEQHIQPYLNLARQRMFEIDFNRKAIAAEQQQEATAREMVTARQNENITAALVDSDISHLNHFPVDFFSEGADTLEDSTDAQIIYIPHHFDNLGAASSARIVNPLNGFESDVIIRRADVKAPTFSNFLSEEMELIGETTPQSVVVFNNKLFIIPTNAHSEEPEAGQVVPESENQLFPDDGLVPEDYYEDTDEEATPMSDLPIA